MGELNSFAAPRVYALDVIIPSVGSGRVSPIVVDFNGSRSGLSAAEAKFGDSRIEVEVLSALAEAGAGRVLAPVLRRSPVLREQISLETILRVDRSSAGIGRARDAYMPVGRTFALDAEERVAKLARRIGILYETLIFDWVPERRTLVAHGPKSQTMNDWSPGTAVVWPYTWDWRAFAFPAASRLVNPLALQLLATNKLFLAAADEASLVDHGASYSASTAAFGFLRDAGEWVENTQRTSANNSGLWVVKPAQGRRGFGVALCGANGLVDYARMAGIEGDAASLKRGLKALAAASLAGDLPEALTLIQPYVSPSIRRHPDTGLLHGTVQRACVLSDGRGARCIDVTSVLFREPRDAIARSEMREARLMTAQSRPICLSPRPDEHDSVAAVATRFVDAVEQYARSIPQEPLAAVRHEAVETARFADRTFQIACTPVVEDAWHYGTPLMAVFAQTCAPRDAMP
ncbi:hypothetical protein [Chenggangzhangella methanolivorans]|uniref:Uncharacterized protein n=1 Tax=Chenggangzhangella methanolivorans TaxID=1437009 RepID=A0A9E6UME1_9HYPH|nr:hypothetical protein [Chenggangzhangella methanolivorans]QZN99103.1 hypothetical protein K6K41_19970 [Chenggangzhangella methanolivorans]